MRTLEARTVRPYQADALSAVGDAYREGHRSPLVVMPTGTGKTIFFAELARRVVKPVLFVTHTRDLVRQTAKKVGAWCEEDVGIEMAASRELTRPTVPADALDLFGGPSQAHRPRARRRLRPDSRERDQARRARPGRLRLRRLRRSSSRYREHLAPGRGAFQRGPAPRESRRRPTGRTGRRLGRSSTVSPSSTRSARRSRTVGCAR